MIEELQGGLRNALERGNSMQQAIQSLINAGYNPQDVQEAAQSLNEESPQKRQVSIPVETPLQVRPRNQSLPPQQPPVQLQPVPVQASSSTKWKPILISLGVLVLVLIGILITIMLTGDTLLKWLTG